MKKKTKQNTSGSHYAIRQEAWANYEMVGWSVEGKCKIDSCSFKVRYLPLDTWRPYRKSQSDRLKECDGSMTFFFRDPNSVNVTVAESWLRKGLERGRREDKRLDR